jgi:delta 1-pyrroline-5-carboxylate dehydrogenase
VHRASATLLLVTVKTVAIVVPRFLADRLGQRPMLLASAGGMAALLLVLGLSMSAAVAGAASWWAAVTCAEAVAAFRFSGRGLAGTCPARGSAPVEARGAVGEVCILEG